MSTKTLEFKEKANEILSLDELRLSVKAKEAGINRNLEHYQVFDKVIDLLAKNNINYTPLPIHVSSSGSKLIEIAEKYVGEKNIKAWYLDKITGIITLDDMKDNISVPRINIEYNERGINIAFGKHVLICSNGMTAFKGDMFSTFGSDKVPFEKGLEMIKGWILELDTKNKIYDNLIAQMNTIDINYEEIPNIIGSLELGAVEQAYLNGPPSPFNISQVSTLSRNIIKEMKKGNEFKNVWDLYNLGTWIQKPDQMDMATINQNNYLFTKLIIDKYNLN
jgi:hypothetical protein